MFSEKSSKFLVGAGILLFALAFCFFINGESLFNKNELIKADKIGQFGDFVGGIIGSLWALAGVILFYVALKEQRSDSVTNRKVLATQVQALEKQIQEFELQREELSLTRKVFKEQRDTLKLQQFESTYFSMLNLHHQIINSIDIEVIKEGRWVADPKKVGTITGRDCFEYFYDKFKTNYNQTTSIEDYLDKIDSAYKKMYLSHQSDLGHYFRNLYNILKFVNKKNPGDKFFYANLLRAQLSSSELLVLFYNCLSQFGKDKFKPLIEDYHFLQNMPKSPLVDRENHKELYDKSAFGKPDK